jgi:hypothetical protein
VRITTTGAPVLATGWVEDEHDVLSFLVPDQPVGVTLDPSNKLLGEAVIGSATGVADDPVRPLARAWPNPFRGTLHLDLAPEARQGAVEIFDLRGRNVAAIAVAGRASVPWDGRDRSGVPVAPGSYFVRVPGGARSFRVVLLR